MCYMSKYSNRAMTVCWRYSTIRQIKFMEPFVAPLDIDQEHKCTLACHEINLTSTKVPNTFELDNISLDPGQPRHASLYLVSPKTKVTEKKWTLQNWKPNIDHSSIGFSFTSIHPTTDTNLVPRRNGKPLYTQRHNNFDIQTLEGWNNTNPNNP